MSKSRSSSKRTQRKIRKKVDGFSKSIGLSPIKILGALLLLGAIGYFIFAVAFAPKNDQNVAKTPSLQKIQQQEFSVDQRLQTLLDANPAVDTNFLVVIEEMNRIDEEVDKIESENELSEAQAVEVEKIRLRNKSVSVMTMVRNKITCEAEKKDLYEYCSSRLESSDDQLRASVEFWLCVIPTIEFVEAPSSETFQNFSIAIETYPGGYLRDPTHAATISGLLLKMSQHGGATTVDLQKKAFSFLAKKMSTSEIDSIQKISGKLESLKLFSEFNLQTLAYRIQWSDPTGREDLFGALEVLTENPDTDMKDWIILIRAYECFLSTDKIEETGAAWQKVWSLTQSISDEKMKTAMQDVLKRQRTRAMSIGTPFDTTGFLAPNGEAFSADGESFTAIIFCDKSINSMAALSKLGKESRIQQLKYRPIVAFENELSEKDLESLHKVPKEILIASDETSRKFYDAFPADFFPYVLLIDKIGNIAGANLDVNQLPGRVARLSASEREAKAAEGDPPTTAPSGAP